MSRTAKAPALRSPGTLSAQASATVAERELGLSLRHPRLRANKTVIKKLIHTLDAHRARFDGGCPDGELSIAFLTDAKLARLHDDFLDDPSTTDVITFEGEPELGIAGEICVSVDTAAAYARTRRRDFSTELSLYLVHGWLHLAGYDDLKPELKRRMRRAEARALRILDKAGLLRGFSLKAH